MIKVLLILALFNVDIILIFFGVSGFSFYKKPSDFIPLHLVNLNNAIRTSVFDNIRLNGRKKDSVAEKVLANPKWPEEWPFIAQDFVRQDESDDSIFYESARLVNHIDNYAVSALTEYYAAHFRDGDDVLDICSSWVSHYPSEWKGGNVVGLGMNPFELRLNQQLSYYVTKDLNIDPTFPFDDGSFDRVTCVVSVDYLTRPREVFAEIGRVLRPRGEAMFSISNRCFPSKAIKIWLQTKDAEHVFIVGSFFHYTGLFGAPSCDDISPYPGKSDPLYIIKASKK